MKNKTEKILGAVAPLVTLAAVLAVWAVAARATGNEYVLPSVSDTVKEFFSLFSYGEFYAALLGTLLRSVIAFCISFAAAWGLAFAAKNKVAEKFISPLIAVLRALPTVAVVLLLLVWTNGNVAPVIVTMLVVLPSSYTNVKNALDGVDGSLLEMCRVYNVPKKTVLFKVKIPAILPGALRSAGAGLSLNVKLMVAAEVLSQTANSLGYLLNVNKVYFETAKMIALVAVTVILGLLCEFAFSRLAARAEKGK